MFDEPVFAVRVDRIKAVQTHPIPDKVSNPQGPFPREMFDEPEIIADYSDPFNEFEPGATAQNNFKPIKFLRCARCLARVPEAQTKDHVCED